MSKPAPATAGVDVEALRALSEPIACAHGVVLLDLAWVGGTRGPVLRATIDRPDDETAPAGGAGRAVSLEDCVAVSRDLSTALDASGSIEHRYRLEVTSPGLDRPLRQARDFRRHVGKLAKCKLAAPAADGQRVLRGTILAVAGDQIRMEVDGKEHLVALANIREARLVVAFGSGQGPRGRTARGHKTKGTARRRSR